MLNITYTISPSLVNELKTVASLRQSILLLPIPTKTEYALQFEFLVERIESSLSLSRVQVEKNEITSILTHYVAYLAQASSRKKNINSTQKLIYGYKNTHDYLRQNWLVTPNHIDIKTIATIHDFTFSGTLKIQEQPISELLDYLQTAAENPVIQAAIAKLAFRALSPFEDGNEESSSFYSYLFLYKAGLDFKGMLDLESGWNADRNEFQRQFAKAISTPNVTSWLEYYTRKLAIQLQAAYSELVRVSKGHEIQGGQIEVIGKLNERQQLILALFEEPNAIITNRTIQKVFKISQITASRDLAKLASLGMLFVHGKGRSVRYTKI